MVSRGVIILYRLNVLFNGDQLKRPLMDAEKIARNWINFR